MIQELRVYTLQPGKQPAFLAHGKEVGMRVRGDKYGRLEGYWSSEVGVLNQAFHLWSFSGLDERAHLLRQLSKDEEWTREYLPKARSMILAQENCILSPAIPLQHPPTQPNVYELRRYQTHPGKAAEWLSLFKDAAAARSKLSPIVGAWFSEAGALNQVAHLWAYRDLNERAEVREQSKSDPVWREFLGKVPPLLVRMESVILNPASFSPLQ